MELLLLLYCIFSTLRFSKNEPNVTTCNKNYITEKNIIKKTLMGDFHLRYAYNTKSDEKTNNFFEDTCAINNFDANKGIFYVKYISKAPEDDTSIMITYFSGTISINDQGFITLAVNYSEMYHSHKGVQNSNMSHMGVPFMITDYGPTSDKIEWFISCHFYMPDITTLAINLLIKEDNTTSTKICPDELDPTISDALLKHNLTINMFDSYKTLEECNNGRICSQKKSGVKTFARISMLTFILVGITIHT